MTITNDASSQARWDLVRPRFIRQDLRLFDFDPKAMRGGTFFEGILEFREKVLAANRHRILPRDRYQCALCKGREGDLLLAWKDGYDLIECRRCGVATANFEVGDEHDQIDAAYNNDTYYEKFMREIVSHYDYRKEHQGRDRYAYIIDRLKLPHDRIRLLDVGCGSGWFLSYLYDHGVECKGLEVNPMAVRFCREQRGLNVESGDLQDEPDKSWDVIGIFDVLEHVADPIGLVTLAKQKLKPGGYLVAYTPHIYSVGWELMGVNQNTLVPFEHIGFFAEKSVQYLADAAGMPIQSVDTFGFDVMDYLLMKEHEDGHDYTTQLRDMMLVVQACLDKLHVGNHFRITLQRPPE